MARFFEYLILFVLVTLLQLLLFDNIQISGYLNILIYPLFLLLLPMNISGFMLLILATVLGSFADIMAGTAGIHSIGTIFIAFMRPTLLKLIVRDDLLSSNMMPSSNVIGIKQFLQYSTLMMFILFTVILLLERLTLDYLFFTILRIIISTIVSVMILFLLQLIFSRNSNRNNF